MRMNKNRTWWWWWITVIKTSETQVRNLQKNNKKALTWKQYHGKKKQAPKHETKNPENDAKKTHSNTKQQTY